LQLLLARILLRGEKFYDYVGHLGIIMLVGVLVLLPGILCFLLPDGLFMTLAGVSVVISSALMISMHYKRTRALGMGISWTVMWLLCLYGGVVFWSFFGLPQIKM
jgi:hypothetical protein